MLAFLVYRAMRSSGNSAEIPSSWHGCHDLAPVDDRQTEFSPAEWMQRLPSSFHDQVAASVEFLAQTLSSEGRRYCNPSLIARHLYGQPGSPSLAGMASAKETGLNVSAIQWRGDIALASRQIIDAKESCDGSIWIEFDDKSPGWDNSIGLMAQQLGAGIWIHPPQRKEILEKCAVMPGAIRWISSSLNWDQWVWPLSDALGNYVAQAMSQCGGKEGWVSPELLGSRSKISRWGKLPAWAWSAANHENSGLMGVSCLALALAINANGLLLREQVL